MFLYLGIRRDEGGGLGILEEDREWACGSMGAFGAFCRPVGSTEEDVEVGHGVCRVVGWDDRRIRSLEA